MKRAVSFRTRRKMVTARKFAMWVSFYLLFLLLIVSLIFGMGLNITFPEVW